MGAKKYSRPLSGMERMRLWYPNINVVASARVDAPLSEDAVRHGLDVQSLRHPLLGSRVEVDPTGHAAFTQEAAPPPELRTVASEDQDTWKTVVESELTRPWDVESGPLARITSVTSASRTDLVFNLHHSICDGRSLARLMVDVIDHALSGETESSVTRVTPIPAESLSNAKPRGLQGLALQILNRKWSPKSVAFGPCDYESLHGEYWASHYKSVSHWSLTHEQTERLVSSAKSHGASVNSVLYVGFLRALQKEGRSLPPAPDRVLVPVDLRRFLPNAVTDALGLYSSAVTIHRVSRLSMEFWKAVSCFDRKVKQAVTPKAAFASQKMSTLQPSLMDGICHALFGSFDDPLARRLADSVVKRTRSNILVSNIGRVADDTANPVSWITPPAVASATSDLAVEVLTYRGKMHFTLTCDSGNREVASRVAACATETIVAETGA